MQLIIISGRSGSGKTTGLQVMEDMGFYCVDNLPIALLPQLAEQIEQENLNKSGNSLENIAVGIDARNLPNQLASFPDILKKLKAINLNYRIIYLDSNPETLLKRFSLTRRKHPLSNEKTSLTEAISFEEKLLQPIEQLAELTIDTSHLTIHQLREAIKQQIYKNPTQQIAILLQSFGFKHGLPIDADLVFDVRCLPNPHWDEKLKPLTGLDQPVQAFLSGQDMCKEMIAEIHHYLSRWLPEFEKNDRSYMTIAIGCTGGKHRSVFVVEQLASLLVKDFSKIQTRHRDIPGDHT
jgi:RNase adapter protein RapZ